MNLPTAAVSRRRPGESFVCVRGLHTEVGTTRTAARVGAVTERLRALDSDAFVGFCAALWRARGYGTRRVGDRFVARRRDERLVVLPRSSPGRAARIAATLRRRLPRDRSVSGSDDDEAAAATAIDTDDDADVDVVVTPVDAQWASRLADRHGARFVGPATLVDLLLYGVPRADADALTAQYFGESTVSLLAESPSTRSDGAASRVATPTALAAVVGVVCLVLAAGAAGVWGPPAPEPLTDAAPPLLTGAGVQPAGTAESSPTPESGDSNESSERYPPGVGEDSLDAVALSRAHADAVSTRSYRLIVRQSDTEALDGNRRWDGVWQHAVVEDERTWLHTVVGYESRANGSDLVQYTLYTEGEFVYRRADTRNGTRYDRYPLRTADDGFGTHTDRSRRYVLRYLTTTDVEVDRVSWRPDEYRIVATGRPTYVDGDISNYTATAFVDESGFVSELTVEFTREAGWDEDDRSARFRLEYAAVGDTEARPPGWYDEATAVTATNATREQQ